MECIKKEIDMEELYKYKFDKSSQNNTLLNDLNNYSEESLKLSSIKEIKSDGTIFNTSSISFIKNCFEENIIPYPNKDEIILIKIKDDNYLETGQNIENYITNIDNFNDDKFNKCKICQKDDNIYFCINCNKNICDSCYKICLSKYHNLFDLKDKLKEIEIDIKTIRKYLELIKNNQEFDNIEKIDNIFETESENEINNELKNSFDIILIEAIIDKKYINYFHYKNIKECLNYIKEKYKGKIDYIILKYKVRNNKIKIFGKNFVNNNKKYCIIIYGNKKYELNEYFKIKNFYKDNILEIKLMGINQISDASYMFYNCKSLIALESLSEWKTNKINNMSHMFYGCESLISFPDISNWNINSVTNMSCMFYKCEALLSLPNISKWNTCNVINMSYMLYKCKSLIALPNISTWETKKVTNMCCFFYNCESLISIPNISLWNTNNVIDMSYMFSGCKSLITLPDISKWNTNNVNDMNYMFSECKSLISLPDISKWNTNNVINISHMFYECESLTTLPDLSKWNTYNISNIDFIFYGCKSLISIPQISKFKANNININSNLEDG